MKMGRHGIWSTSTIAAYLLDGVNFCFICTILVLNFCFIYTLSDAKRKTKNAIKLGFVCNLVEVK